MIPIVPVLARVENGSARGSTLRMIFKQATRVRRDTFGNRGYTM